MSLKKISLATFLVIVGLVSFHFLRKPSLIDYFPKDEREDFAKAQRDANHILEKVQGKGDKEVVDAFQISFACCSALEGAFREGKPYVFLGVVIMTSREVRLYYGTAYLLLEGLEGELKKRGYESDAIDKMKKEALVHLDEIMGLWARGSDFFTSLFSGSDSDEK